MLVSALALDPIEKKPLARFHPGSMILSVGSVGCTMHCPWCQNHHIALPDDPSAVDAIEMSATELATRAAELVSHGNIGLAYTYNEPLLRWREVLECAREVHDRGLLNVLVTNGQASEGRVRELLPYIDAWQIDLKAFSQDVYDLGGGSLETVKRTIELAASAAHVEVTMLLVPELSSDLAQVEASAAWLASIDPSIPLHLSRFFGRHLYADRPPTPLPAMHEARDLARRHLDDVLLGNV